MGVKGHVVWKKFLIEGDDEDLTGLSGKCSVC